MKETTLLITNEIGLHARPATFFIQRANEFKSKIIVKVGDREANAKSLLGVLSLGIEQGTELTITAEGPDESEAVASIEALVQSNFRS